MSTSQPEKKRAQDPYAELKPFNKRVSKKPPKKERARGPEITWEESLRSVNGMVRRMCKKYGYETILDQILYCEPSRELRGYEIFLQDPRYRKNNHFHGMKMVCRKGGLTQALQKMQKDFPNEFQFYPESYDMALPAQFARLERNFDPTKVWILKPTSGHQGDGICIARSWAEVQGLYAQYQRVVAQQYVDRPLLMNGLKFDFRIYCLVENCFSMRSYVFHDGLARFCTQAYEEPNSENFKNAYQHLTNFSLNKFSPHFKVAEPPADYIKTMSPEAQEKALNPNYDYETEASKRKVSVALEQICEEYNLPVYDEDVPMAERTFLGDFAREGPQNHVKPGEATAYSSRKHTVTSGYKPSKYVYPQVFWTQAINLVSHTLMGIQPNLVQGYNEKWPVTDPRDCPRHRHLYSTRPPTRSGVHHKPKEVRCFCPHSSVSFHVIGFDVLLDEEFNLHLLELNNNPSFACRDSIMDAYCKIGVMESALRLMEIVQHQEDAEDKKERDATQNSELLTLPVDEDGCPDYTKVDSDAPRTLRDVALPFTCITPTRTHPHLQRNIKPSSFTRKRLA